MKCIIIGGGISGLATAFFIKQKYNFATIALYEKNQELGGYARSVQKDGYVTEHSPRVIAIGYKYFFKIVHSVPAIFEHIKVVTKKKDIGFRPKKIDLVKIVFILIKYIITGEKTNQTFENVVYKNFEPDIQTKYFIDNFLHKLGKGDKDLPFDLIINLMKVFLKEFTLKLHYFDLPFQKHLLNH